MKQTVDYSKLQEPEKTKKALADFKAYCGGNTKQYKAALALCKKSPTQFAIGCEMFLGVEGFPVDAMIRTYGPKAEYEKRHPVCQRKKTCNIRKSTESEEIKRIQTMTGDRDGTIWVGIPVQFGSDG
jgi:hypothetical protein